MKPAEWFKRLPWSVVLCTLVLMAGGLSAIGRGDELSGGGNYQAKQVVWMMLALPAMFAATVVPYHALKRHARLLFAGGVILLVAVYVFPEKHGSHRWIPLGLMSFQPSELVKLLFIAALAEYLMFRENTRRLTGLILPFCITLLPLVLILREPDLGTAMLFLPVLFAMLFAAGARPRHLTLIAALGISVLPVLWLGMNAEQKSRVVTLFVQQDGGPVPQGDDYHLHQSKQVLALGGVWGSQVTGTAVDDPLAYHLPASRTDFVFCMLGERWGLAGCGVLLAAYVLLFARALWIAAATREPFGKLLVTGIAALLASQVFINTGMTVGLMPITGLTLPLVSYGGSSLLFTCFALGLVMNVAIRPGYQISHEPFRFAKKSHGPPRRAAA